MTEALNKSAAPAETARSVGMVSLSHEMPTAEELAVIETRNAWLDAQLNDNPDQPLPVVNLRMVVDPDAQQGLERSFNVTSLVSNTRDKKKFYQVRNADNETVGMVTLVEPYADSMKPPKSHIEFIKIAHQNRGKGYGPATYLELLKSLPEGAGLKSDTVLSADGIKAWERLVRKGVARKVEGEYVTTTGYETVF